MAKLTDEQIQQMIAPAVIGDGDGLYIRGRGSSKTWQFRYKRGGRSHLKGLGAYPAVSLEAAREKAKALRASLQGGESPTPVVDAQHISAGPLLWSVAAFSKAHGVSATTVGRMIAAGQLDAVRGPAGKRLITEASAARWRASLVPVQRETAMAFAPPTVRARRRI
jgi:hypothetical protein